MLYTNCILIKSEEYIKIKPKSVTLKAIPHAPSTLKRMGYHITILDRISKPPEKGGQIIHIIFSNSVECTK